MQLFIERFVFTARGEKNGKVRNYNVGGHYRGNSLVIILYNCRGRKKKYEIAVRELKGKKNVAIVITIFIVMIFLMMGIAHPDIKIDLSM